MIWLVSLKIPLPELVYQDQDEKKFSIYKLTQILFADPYLAHLLKSFTTENNDASSAKSFTVDSKLSDKSLI